MTTEYDAIIIGTGQAGPALSARLADAGMHVAVVERHHFGGTCVNSGCITKTLVASARVAYVARRAADYGIELSGQVRVDMAKVKARKDAVVRRSTEGVEKWMRTLEAATVYAGHATFDDAHVVRVGEERLTAHKTSSTSVRAPTSQRTALTMSTISRMSA